MFLSQTYFTLRKYFLEASTSASDRYEKNIISNWVFSLDLETNLGEGNSEFKPVVIHF